MENKEHVWHKEVISRQVERSLGDLRALGVLDRCYLAGGTGWALHLGHRRSQDLDFFSSQEVEPETLIQKLQTLLASLSQLNPRRRSTRPSRESKSASLGIPIRFFFRSNRFSASPLLIPATSPA